jgi:2-amino-4-hydroxy-6-hydroxymethyldihydropteridine diphosphokinase
MTRRSSSRPWKRTGKISARTRRRPTTTSTEVAALGLGSNLGDSEGRLRAAINDLRSILRSLQVAPLFQTLPFGDLPRQPPYLNTAVVGLPRLDADELLAAVKALELAAGRRAGPRHGPRPLDIDLLLYGERISSRRELLLPHPGLRHRRFVLAPLAEIAPDLTIPPNGPTVAEALSQVGQEDQVTRIAWQVPP